MSRVFSTKGHPLISAAMYMNPQEVMPQLEMAIADELVKAFDLKNEEVAKLRKLVEEQLRTTAMLQRRQMLVASTRRKR